MTSHNLQGISLAAALLLSACSGSDGDTESMFTDIATSPGALIGATTVDAPSGITAADAMVRMTYDMSSITGGTTTGSALMFEPSGTAPTGGHSLVVWAHGTTGIANACAPSSAPGSLLNLEAIDRLIDAGYAVLVPDYEGFGTPTPHPYYLRDSHANSVIDAVTAAHDVEGTELSDSWAIVGHSQGGHVALATARGDLDPSYPLAAVAALAPGTDLRNVSDNAFAAIDADIAAGNIDLAVERLFYLNIYGAYVAHAFDQVLPAFEPRDLFDGAVADLIDIALDEPVCGTYARTVGNAASAHAANGGTIADFGGLRRDWYTDATLIERIASETIGDEPQAAPLLIVQGDADRQIPVAATDAFVMTQLNLGTDVTYEVIAGGRHGVVARSEFQRTLNWLADRFPAR